MEELRAELERINASLSRMSEDVAALKAHRDNDSTNIATFWSVHWPRMQELAEGTEVRLRVLERTHERITALLENHEQRLQGVEQILREFEQDRITSTRFEHEISEVRRQVVAIEARINNVLTDDAVEDARNAINRRIVWWLCLALGGAGIGYGVNLFLGGP